MVDVDTPPSFSRLPEPFIGALRELARTRRLLVALDFDGTLAPEVDDPEQARALPEARAAVLRLLEMPNTRIALVSGRALASLIHVADVPDRVLLVGSHGIELRLDDPDDDLALDAAERARVNTLKNVLDEVADSFDEVWLESKPAGFALHTRMASDHHSRIAHLVARSETAAEDQGLTVRDGKDVLEFSVRSTTKGEALEHLRAYTDATAVFYAGDDITDEDAFAALGADDVGLKSGDGQTLANFRVAGPIDVARALNLLADLRDGDVHEQ
jgi:trehalose 6-phosphate phosphatase